MAEKIGLKNFCKVFDQMGTTKNVGWGQFILSKMIPNSDCAKDSFIMNGAEADGAVDIGYFEKVMGKCTQTGVVKLFEDGHIDADTKNFSVVEKIEDSGMAKYFIAGAFGKNELTDPASVRVEITNRLNFDYAHPDSCPNQLARSLPPMVNDMGKYLNLVNNLNTMTVSDVVDLQLSKQDLLLFLNMSTEHGDNEAKVIASLIIQYSTDEKDKLPELIKKMGDGAVDKIKDNIIGANPPPEVFGRILGSDFLDLFLDSIARQMSTAKVIEIIKSSQTTQYNKDMLAFRLTQNEISLSQVNELFKYVSDFSRRDVYLKYVQKYQPTNLGTDILEDLKTYADEDIALPSSMEMLMILRASRDPRFSGDADSAIRGWGRFSERFRVLKSKETSENEKDLAMGKIMDEPFHPTALALILTDKNVTDDRFRLMAAEKIVSMKKANREALASVLRMSDHTYHNAAARKLLKINPTRDQLHVVLNSADDPDLITDGCEKLKKPSEENPFDKNDARYMILHCDPANKLFAAQKYFYEMDPKRSDFQMYDTFLNEVQDRVDDRDILLRVNGLREKAVKR